MPDPGDVVTADFPGAQGTKRRPAVVVSSSLVIGLVTSNIGAATSPTDCIIQDWDGAGLRSASAFRSFFAMRSPGQLQKIGRLSPRDWTAVQTCVRLAFAI